MLAKRSLTTFTGLTLGLWLSPMAAIAEIETDLNQASPQDSASVRETISPSAEPTDPLLADLLRLEAEARAAAEAEANSESPVEADGSLGTPDSQTPDSQAPDSQTEDIDRAEDIKTAVVDGDRGSITPPSENGADAPFPTVLKLGRVQNNLEELQIAPATLYSYDLDGKAAATVYLEGLPVLTFIEPSIPSSAESAATTALERASNFTAQLNLLAQRDLDGVEIELSREGAQLAIAVDGEPIETIDEMVKPERGSSRAGAALAATNRIRRLLVGAAALNSVPGGISPIAAGTVIARQAGLASWYGPGFAGRPSASGEIFNPNAMTAAHRYLPFGTLVEVINISTGRSAIVRINDRGPFIGNRIIDLSARAARAIGLLGAGVGPVELRILGR